MPLVACIVLISVTVSLRSVPTSGPVSPLTLVPLSKRILDRTSRGVFVRWQRAWIRACTWISRTYELADDIVVMGCVMDTDVLN